jgi:hypothetical protein
VMSERQVDGCPALLRRSAAKCGRLSIFTAARARRPKFVSCLKGPTLTTMLPGVFARSGGMCTMVTSAPGSLLG